MIAKKAGYDGIELILRSEDETGYADTWDVKYLQKLGEENDIKIYALHLPFIIEKCENPEAILRETKEFAKTMGVKNIVMHVPRSDQEIYLKWFESKDWSKKSAVNVCMENLWTKPGKADPVVINPADFKRFENVCFDTAHSLRCNIPPLDFVRQLSNIRHMHCSFWDESEDHLSIQDSKKLFKELFKDLPRSVGSISTELRASAFDDIFDEEAITEFLRKECLLIKSAI